MSHRFSRSTAALILCLASLGAAQAEPLLTHSATAKTRAGEVSSARKLDVAKGQFVETVCESKPNAQPDCRSQSADVNAETAACLKARFAYEGSDAQHNADVSAKTRSGEREVKTSWLPCASNVKS